MERQKCVVREESGAVLGKPDRPVGDAETRGDIGCRDRLTDEVVGGTAVGRRVAGDDRCGGGEVGACDRRKGAVAERGLEAGGRPRQQGSEQLGIESVAQDGPRQAAGADQLLGDAVGEREAEVVAGARQARVDDVGDAVAGSGIQDRPVPGDDAIVLGVARRDEYQRRDAREVEAGGIVEVDEPLPLGRVRVPPMAGMSRAASSWRVSDASCPFAPVTMIIAVGPLGWFSSVTTMSFDRSPPGHKEAVLCQ
ncbi:hypothetical protein PUW81_013330 [Microbacterium sp. NM3R9]|nr:hypothetical protein [Microbacterium thalli]MDN8550089.1 hypothetical protein [Microbacterium thalli]